MSLAVARRILGLSNTNYGLIDSPSARPGEKKKEKAPWEREEDIDPKRVAIFQDDNFIGRVKDDKGADATDAPWTQRQSHVDDSSYDVPTSLVDSNGDLYKGPELKKPEDFREKAPWERTRRTQEEQDEESAFLEGKIPVLADRRHSKGKGRFNKIPSKAFSRLCRSMSRETSPSPDLPTSGYTSADENELGPDPDNAYRDYVYIGKKIPSKAFLRLRKSVDRKSELDTPPTPDEFDKNLKSRYTDGGTSQRVQDVLIENQKPEEYLATLKREMEESGIKIEPSPEATDF